MANKPPAFQFYVKDWLSSESVVVMTPEQRGWYIQLLCHCWNGEPIATLPADDRKLKALAGAGDNWATDKQAVLDCFEVQGDRLVNRRLVNQYQELQEFRNSKSEAGRKGNEKRWGKDRDGVAQQSLSDDSAIANDRSSSSPSSVTSKGNVTVTGSKSEDSKVEQEGKDQEPNLGETPNPHRDKLTLSEIVCSDNHPAWLRQMMEESYEVRRKVICVAEWVDSKSTVWKGKPCLGLGGYRAMESSYDKFYAKIPAGKKPHERPVQEPKADPALIACDECGAIPENCICSKQPLEPTPASLRINEDEEEPKVAVKPAPQALAVPHAPAPKLHPPQPGNSGHHFLQGRCLNCKIFITPYERNRTWCPKDPAGPVAPPAAPFIDFSRELTTLIEGQVDVEGIDDVEVPKSKAFQIEED